MGRRLGLAMLLILRLYELIQRPLLLLRLMRCAITLMLLVSITWLLVIRLLAVLVGRSIIMTLMLMVLECLKVIQLVGVHGLGVEPSILHQVMLGHVVLLELLRTGCRLRPLLVVAIVAVSLPFHRFMVLLLVEAISRVRPLSGRLFVSRVAILVPGAILRTELHRWQIQHLLSKTDRVLTVEVVPIRLRDFVRVDLMRWVGRTSLN